MNYWESTAPGEGRVAPRADALSDARRESLNGTWRFRLSSTASGTPGFEAPGFDDSGWDQVAVPGHWVLQEVTLPGTDGPRSLRGTADGPLYTNTALPMPLDPPHVPTENPTGDYRTTFTAPAGWGRTVLRFQGVDSCAKVWLNGEELGWSTGSRLPFEFEAPLVEGENTLAVRVHRWSSGTYLEDQDMWWLPGIFRDVELLERPDGGIDDHHVHASFDHLAGIGTLRVDAPVAATVEIPELGITMAAGESASIPVAPWSADSPRLYRGTLSTATESVDLAIGFRSVVIVDGRLTVNGAPVFFRGVNRHEHDPDTGRTLDRATMIRDIELMKQHNVNAVRTSHYPPHPDFLRLCDEYGLWVVEECDIETHGFIYTGWEGNPPAVAEWLPALQDRVERMVERDKNRPSVIVWSMANESWTGDNFGVLEQWIRDRDPSRVILYERDPSYRNSDFYSLMYPSLEALEAIGRREEPRPDNVTDEEDARRRTLPFLLCEYAHAMGNGPGSLLDYHRILRGSDRFCGGFVWEWIDHGFTASSGGHDDGQIMHGTDVAYRPNGGRFCLDGLVFSDRTPSPGLTELGAVLQPVSFAFAPGEVTITNEHDHGSLDHLAFRWRVEVEGELVESGLVTVPAVAAGDSATVPLPVSGSDRETWVTVEAVLAADAIWARAGHVVAFGQAQLSAGRARRDLPAPSAGRAASAGRARRDHDTITLGPATFDATSGRLTSFRGAPVDGPHLDLHRAPIENDRGQGGNNDLAAIWTAVGIDRMQHRTDVVDLAGDVLTVRGRSGPAAHGHGVEYEFRWTALADDALHLAVSVDFVGAWKDTPFRQRDIVVPRLGLRFRLPAAYAAADWFGLGPGETYVDSLTAARVGRFAAPIDALKVDYPVPQENGNHTHTRALSLSGAGVPDLHVEGAPLFDFTVRRWTSLDLERARKPRDLQDSGFVWLNLDHAQQGIGSASCGPALPAQYRIPREHTEWELTLR